MTEQVLSHMYNIQLLTLRSLSNAHSPPFFHDSSPQAALARASQILLSQKNKKPKVRKIKGRKTRALRSWLHE